MLHTAHIGMKRSLVFALALLAAILACSAPNMGPAPTTAPEQTPEGLGSAPPTARRALIQSGDFSLAIYSADGQSTPFAGKTDFILQPGVSDQYAVSGDTLYALSGFSAADPARPTRGYQIDPSGAHLLEAMPEGAQRFVAWPGDSSRPARIAWGEYQTDQTPMRIMIADVNAGSGTPAYEMINTETLLYVVPYRWNADGVHLYFSIEPSGLGGYILYGGRSSLYSLDTSTGESTQIIQPDPERNIICLDELSPDETMIGSHCDNQIGVVNLQTGQKTVIAPPSDVPMAEVGQMGDVRFSLDGTQIAFALARGEPDNEQVWIAVTDDLSGSSRLIFTSPAGGFYNVVGWLDSDHLLISAFSPETNLSNLMVLPIDGSPPRDLAQGATFIAFVP